MSNPSISNNVRRPITTPAFVIPQPPTPESQKTEAVDAAPAEQVDGFVPAEESPVEVTPEPTPEAPVVQDSPELSAAKAKESDARWSRAGSFLKAAGFVALGVAALATAPVSAPLALGMGVTSGVGTILMGVEASNKTAEVQNAQAKVESLSAQQQGFIAD